MKEVEISLEEATNRMKAKKPVRSCYNLKDGMLFFRPLIEVFEVECWINDEDCYRKEFYHYKQAISYIKKESKKENVLQIDLNHYKDITYTTWNKQMNFKMDGIIKTSGERDWEHQ